MPTPNASASVWGRSGAGRSAWAEPRHPFITHAISVGGLSLCGFLQLPAHLYPPSCYLSPLFPCSSTFWGSPRMLQPLYHGLSSKAPHSTSSPLSLGKCACVWGGLRSPCCPGAVEGAGVWLSLLIISKHSASCSWK